MKLKQVWMHPVPTRKSRYGLVMLGGAAGIVLLMTVLAAGGAVLGLAVGLPRGLFSLVLVALVTVLGLVLSMRLGRRGLRDATLFFLTEDDRLYVLDARALTRVGASLASQTAWIMRTQEHLRRLAEAAALPAEAREIRKVTGMRERRGDWVVHCQCQAPGGRTVPSTCFVVKGYADEDLLLWQLERRRTWAGAPDIAVSQTPVYLVLSGAVLAGFVVLCALSHPAVGRLPQSLYFPCLGAAFLAFFAFVLFCIKQSRGE